MRILRALRELQDALGDWERYQHIYWNLDLEQTYAILHQDLGALTAFSDAIQGHLQKRRSGDP